MAAKSNSAPSGVRSKMFAPDVVIFKGVEIEVRPLPFWKVPVVWNELGSILMSFFEPDASGSVALTDAAEKAITALHGRMSKLMKECVSIPEEPNFNVAQLPFKVFPQIMKLIIEQNFEPGEWRDLAQLVGWERIEASMSQALTSLMQLGQSLLTKDTPTAKSDDTPPQP